MKSVFIFLCLILHLSSMALSQIPFHGGCPKYETQKDFDIKRYLGKWYEIEKYFNFFEFGTTCVSQKLITQKDGTTTLTLSLTRPLSGRRLSKTGVIREISGTNSTGKLSISFTTIPFFNHEQYYVLATDYSSYAIVSSCRDIFGFRSFRKIWVLARDKIPSREVKGQIYSHLNGLGINLHFLRSTQQENCSPLHDLPNSL